MLTEEDIFFELSRSEYEDAVGLLDDCGVNDGMFYYVLTNDDTKNEYALPLDSALSVEEMCAKICDDIYTTNEEVINSSIVERQKEV